MADGSNGVARDEETGLGGDDAANVVPIKGGDKPAPDKLTGKQQAFVQGILKGMSQSDAYRGAYNCENMAASSIWREASVLLTNPKVSGRLKALQARQDDAALHSGLATRQHIQRTLYRLTKDGENDAAKLRACELLGKLSDVAAFTDRVEQVADSRTAEVIQAELEEKLRAAFGETG